VIFDPMMAEPRVPYGLNSGATRASGSTGVNTVVTDVLSITQLWGPDVT